MVLKNAIEFITIFMLIPWCLMADTEKLYATKLFARYAFTLAMIIVCVFMEFSPYIVKL